ncbi:helix-turn-helix transcriptional regulator [Pseudomonas aeruginosa]|nr:helix-turn-helix transcriptional regulator [Pseudomonas aeruginosa]
MARPAPPDLSDSRRPLRGVARSYPAGHRVDAHEHAWGQVLYAVSGMMWLETPDEALPVPPQRAVWLPPGLRHAVRVASELQMRNIYLSPELSRGLEDRTLVLVVGPLLRELIVGLVEQERQSEPAYYQALASLAVLELGRARRSSLRVPLPDASDRRLLALCQAVMANPSLEIGLERLAEDAGASVRTRSRLFQRGLGMGFADWRRQVQLATAAAALIDGRAVSRIAHELGYTPSAFSDMFRRELGVSPSEYKAEHHQPSLPCPVFDSDWPMDLPSAT